jgi:hypothetical protein
METVNIARTTHGTLYLGNMDSLELLLTAYYFLHFSF